MRAKPGNKIYRAVACALAATLLLCACAGGGTSSREATEDWQPPMRAPNFRRDVSRIDFGDVSYTPWDVAGALAGMAKQPERDYTVMIYMIGSDLESLEGEASEDIAEILGSGVDTQRINVVLLTGGANVWHNSVIPAQSSVLWRVDDGALTKLADIGPADMGNAGTLASFIDFCLRGFPAERHALVFWDHAGGSIAGFGHDEKFDSTLSLLEMNYAFERVGLRDKPLELMGFDACLMATAEMAVIAAPYAKYLVASQDLEPGDGWDYVWLGGLHAEMDGEAVGRLIADTFMSFYGRRYREPLTLSVVDLSRAGEVMAAMGVLMRAGSNDLAQGGEQMFGALSGRRGRTKTFGGGSPRDAQCDMVDLAELARSLRDLYPNEARKLLAALERAVVYNRHNSRTDLGGLSAYFIFAGKENAAQALEIYAALGMSAGYTAFLQAFAQALTGQPMPGVANQPPESYLCMHLTMWQPLDGQPGSYAKIGLRNHGDPAENLWPRVGGQFVCLYPLEHEEGRSLYAIPGRHNGRDVNFVLLRCAEHPLGKILGARQREGALIQKGYDTIETGDVVAFYHAVRDFAANEDAGWRGTPLQTVEGALRVTWEHPPAQGHYYSLLRTDMHLGEHYSPLKVLPPRISHASQSGDCAVAA